MALQNAFNSYDKNEFSVVYEEFGKGAFGKVEINRFRKNNTEVAIKWPEKPGTINIDIENHKLVSECPFIVTLFGTVNDKKNDAIGIVLEPCYLETLHEAIFRTSPQLLYNVLHIVVWIEQLASAIIFMKEKGIVHQDIKPNNILLQNNHRNIRLCDLGLAAHQGTNDRCGVGVNNPPLRGFTFEGHLSHYKDDVYAAGMVLWSLVHRELPFGGLSAKEFRPRIENGERPKSEKLIHRDIQMVIENCWAHDLQDRWEPEKLQATMIDWRTEILRHLSFSPPALCKQQRQLIRPHGTYKCLHHQRSSRLIKFLTLSWRSDFALVERLGFCLPKSDRLACSEDGCKTISPSLQVNKLTNGIEKSDKEIFNKIRYTIEQDFNVEPAVNVEPDLSHNRFQNVCKFLFYSFISISILFLFITSFLYFTDKRATISKKKIQKRWQRDIKVGWWLFWITTALGINYICSSYVVRLLRNLRN